MVERRNFSEDPSHSSWLEQCVLLCLWNLVLNLLHSPCSNGSATSEDLFWKLDALQMFVLDLHWPEPEFATHLEQRLKLMASDMMEACVKRSDWEVATAASGPLGSHLSGSFSLFTTTKIYYISVIMSNSQKFWKKFCFSSLRTKSAFDAKMQKASKSTDFRVPLSVCTMFNVLMDAKKQCSKLCVLDTGQEVS